MAPEGVFSVALLLGLLLNALVQVALSRRGWLRSFVLGCGAGLLLFAVLVLWARWRPGLLQPHPFKEFLALVAAGSLAYAACSFFYFSVVNGGKSALRVRLLQELRTRPDGLTMAEILERYPPREMFRTRLERLLAHGQVVLRDGRYRIGSPLVLAIARAVFALKRLVVGTESEFAPRGGAR